MFETKSIGKKIVNLRKANNITQMELADLMGVSYQAVSNWERGNSMPDISKLPELTKILNISIDELLSDEKSLDLIKNVIDGTEDNYIKNKKISIEEIAEISPILKLEQTEIMVDKIVDDNKGKITIRELTQIAGSIDEDYLYKLIKQVNEDFSMDDLCELAPYLDEDHLGNLALEAMKSHGIDGLESIAPYMDENCLDEIAKKIDDVEKIMPLAPYLSEDAMHDVAMRILAGDKTDDIVELLPYMDDDDIGDLAIKAAKAGHIELVNIMAPYVDEDIIHDVADILVKKYGIKGIKGIAPYL